jgi:hypothetical protein
MINYQPKEPASIVFKGNAASVPDDVLSAWDHGLFVACADGPYVVIRDRAGARLEPRVSAAERAAADLSNKALRLLFESDRHVIRAQETGQRPLALEWLAWREQLREVVRGVRMEIPEEPPRYANAPL